MSNSFLNDLPFGLSRAEFWKGQGTNAQTGVSDIPLTANGERMVKEMAPRMVGEKSSPPPPFKV